MKPTLYLETTIPSYLTARPSWNVVTLGHQRITQEWWAKRRSAYAIYIALPVLDEAMRGDPKAAAKRLKLLEGLQVLEPAPEIEELAKTYYAELRLPERAVGDASHLAFAAYHAIDYLLTWNCSHLANAHVRRRLRQLNERLGRSTPIICTPEELMGHTDG